MDLIEIVDSWRQHHESVVKIVTALAAPGGIWFWVDKYRKRINVKVRASSLPTGDRMPHRLTFEVENIGGELTSLEPTFALSGYSMGKIPTKFEYTIESPDRQLPVHVCKQITASHGKTESAELLFLWYTTIRLRLSRGRTSKIRFRNILFTRLGFFRFHFERLRYLWFNKLPDEDQDMGAMRRT